MSLLVEAGCTCHLGHPPCSFCTDTTLCSVCHNRCEIDDLAVRGDNDEAAVCLECAQPDKDNPDYLQGDCANCGRTRIQTDGTCEKCSWDQLGKCFTTYEEVPVANEILKSYDGELPF